MSTTITAAQLRAIAGSGARSDMVAAIVNGWPAAVAKAKLSTRLRAAHFLAQIMTETGGLQILEESGAYSAKRILEIFGAHHSAKIGPDEARRIAALPVSQHGPVLFNRVYGVGNPRKMREFNNTGPNDGWLYRGGGMMQATGKSNYAALEKKTGLPLVAHPELLHQPSSAFVAAYLEWIQDGRCNAAADRDQVVTVRKIINGGDNGLAECERFLARAKKALADYSPDAQPATFVSDPDDLAADQVDDQAEADQQPVDPAPAFDPNELASVQRRLKAMNFNPGIALNGGWGGMTAGAIAGFINDRGMTIAVPTSPEMFATIATELEAEISRAEGENWKRPVSAERASGDLKVVAQAAPEVVPAHRNFIATAWASLVAFFAAVGNSISGYVSRAFDFFSDHKDDLPSDPGILSKAWEYLGHVPAAAWLMLAAAAFGFVAINSLQGIRKIREQVQSGVRQ